MRRAEAGDNTDWVLCVELGMAKKSGSKSLRPAGRSLDTHPVGRDIHHGNTVRPSVWQILIMGKFLASPPGDALNAYYRL